VGVQVPPRTQDHAPEQRVYEGHSPLAVNDLVGARTSATRRPGAYASGAAASRPFGRARCCAAWGRFDRILVIPDPDGEQGRRSGWGSASRTRWAMPRKSDVTSRCRWAPDGPWSRSPTSRSHPCCAATPHLPPDASATTATNHRSWGNTQSAWAAGDRVGRRGATGGQVPCCRKVEAPSSSAAASGRPQGASSAPRRAATVVAPMRFASAASSPAMTCSACTRRR
jgi:hypothetical protein